MRVFVSYASENRSTAEPIVHSIRARGHTVFFDNHDLAAGADYERNIEVAISKSDAFVFLISPHSIEPGSFALTELGIARRKWERPAGRILPVLIAPTDFDAIDPYLRAVTILKPVGNVAAETAASLEALARVGWPSWMTRLAVSAFLVVAFVALAAIGGPAAYRHWIESSSAPAAIFDSLGQAERTVFRRSSGTLDKPFDPKVAAYYQDDVLPPIAAAYRSSFELAQAYDEVLTALSKGRDISALSSKLGRLGERAAAAWKTGEKLSGGALPKLLKPVSKNVFSETVLQSRDSGRAELVKLYPEMREMVVSLRDSTEQMYEIMRRRYVVPGSFETDTGRPVEHDPKHMADRKLLADWVEILDRMLETMDEAIDKLKRPT
jgi:hypothetical protein